MKTRCTTKLMQYIVILIVNIIIINLTAFSESSNVSNQKKSEITAQAVVTAIDAKNHQIRIIHESMNVLGWRANEKNFSVMPNVSLTDLKVGDHIKFSLEKTNDRRFVIIAIKKIPNPNQSTGEISAQAVITAIDSKNQTIRIIHEAIGELGWRPKEQDFSVEANVSLADLKVGEHIQFNLEKTNDKRFVITAIKKVPNPNQNTGEISAQAVITAIDSKNQTIRIIHESIGELGWRASEKDFSVASNISLIDLKVGDRIQFSLEKTNDRSFLITAIKKLPD